MGRAEQVRFEGGVGTAGKGRSRWGPPLQGLLGNPGHSLKALNSRGVWGKGAGEWRVDPQPQGLLRRPARPPLVETSGFGDKGQKPLFILPLQLPKPKA